MTSKTKSHNLNKANQDAVTYVFSKSVWFTQNQMVEFFGKTVECELLAQSVIRNFLMTVSYFKKYEVKHYNLNHYTGNSGIVIKEVCTNFARVIQY